MKPDPHPPRSQEIELKLALPGSDPSGLAKRLGRIPVLARRKPTHQHLHNVYYDTPGQLLRQERVALRLRRVGSDARPQWLQTLKTGGRDDSALSQRGEWETPVPGAALVLQALKATPWESVDPDGTVFSTLVPCFVTSFERTKWLVRRRDGSVVEVALDVGQTVVGDKSAPICELELELLAGQPAALFELAQQIASTIAVLPASISKAERGYALAQGGVDMPRRAQPPKLTPDLPLPEAARRVLGEMFCQFTCNLDALRTSDDPEVVHQARVGWRRFRSAWRLFKPALAVDALPPWQALQPLLIFLGELRDLDVARTDTLPPLADAYTAGNARRAQAWQAMTQALLHAAHLQRKSVRYALEEPVVGAALLATTQWLEGLSARPAPEDARVEVNLPLRHWAKRRMARLHEQLQRALKAADKPDNLHRVRILAKRMRYDIEALRTLLPKRRTQRWNQQAVSLQMRIGATRDVVQAAVLVAKLEADRGLVEFLRGVTVGFAT
ncbi:CYTH and CHAD domain-containing protein [Rhodoferax sp. UBA5149]|uniref:CYTH and CHAD domain-containing protein n=1 Tax=Rhodoferax sp. UBA5149 TaxID=1947379 RepID=UPI0025E85F66|nr:CYTH and CHAD domain-containing protein [Rhodoferax sp. UBA5149]